MTKINGEDVNTAEAFFHALEKVAHGSRVPIKYHPVQDAEDVRVGVLVADRLWYGLRWCRRDAGDTPGTWPCTEGKEAAPAGSFISDVVKAQ